MSTLCLSDMGELHDEWLREPAMRLTATASAAVPGLPVTEPRDTADVVAASEAVAA